MLYSNEIISAEKQFYFCIQHKLIVNSQMLIAK